MRRKADPGDRDKRHAGKEGSEEGRIDGEMKRGRNEKKKTLVEKKEATDDTRYELYMNHGVLLYVLQRRWCIAMRLYKSGPDDEEMRNR